MSPKKANHDTRSYVFECTPGLSVHRDAPDPLEVIVFNHLASLRSHAVKHFANAYEVEAWQNLLEVDHDKIRSCIDGLRNIHCPYFILHSDRPPCWQNGRLCQIYHECSSQVHFLEETYESCIVEAISRGISIPRNVKFHQKRDGVLKEDYWVVPDIAVVVKMYWNGSTYSVATSFQPKAGFRVTWSEILESLKGTIFRQAEGRISWCNEETWGTPIRPDMRKRKRQLPSLKKSPDDKKGGKIKLTNKERGGSRNLTTDFRIFEDDGFDD